MRLKLLIRDKTNYTKSGALFLLLCYNPFTNHTDFPVPTRVNPTKAHLNI